MSILKGPKNHIHQCPECGEEWECSVDDELDVLHLRVHRRELFERLCDRCYERRF